MTSENRPRPSYCAHHCLWFLDSALHSGCRQTLPPLPLIGTTHHQLILDKPPLQYSSVGNVDWHNQNILHHTWQGENEASGVTAADNTFISLKDVYTHTPSFTASTTTDKSPALGTHGFPLRDREPSKKNSRFSLLCNTLSMYCSRGQ